MRELKIKNLPWISIINPTRQDQKELKERFPQIHNLILEEIIKPTIRTRVENFGESLFMILHFPSFIEKQGRTVSSEVDFILLPDALITVQYDNNKLLEDFWHQNKDDFIEDQYGHSPIHFLYYLLRGYFSFLTKELDQIQLKMDKLEDQAFSSQEKESLKKISSLRKSVLDFRKAIKPQHLTLESLIKQGSEFYGKKVSPLLTELLGEYTRVWSHLENHKEVLDALYDTHFSLVTIRTNEAVRSLTLLALMTFIPMTIAGIFGINALDTPLVRQTNGFWLVIVFMIMVMTLSYLVLKWRKII